MLRSLSHPNIIKLHSVFETEESVHLVFDNVEPILIDVYPEEDIIKFSRNLIHAVNYLHSKNIIHRNICIQSLWVENINDLHSFKLTNFDCATYYNPKAKPTLICGNLFYAAPEMKNKKPYGQEVDIYNVGLLIFVIITRNYYSDQPINIKEKLTELKFNNTDEFDTSKKISYKAIEFISKLTQENPNYRPTAIQALNEEWLKNIKTIRSKSPIENIKQYKYMYT